MNGECPSHNEMARKRWKLLARALQRHREADVTGPGEDVISVRRITSFGLLQVRRLDDVLNDADAVWFEYSANICQDRYSLQICHPVKNVTAEELMGFNNTGNVCVWPSEEVLAYYALCDRPAFDDKTVLELGGGMTCLAGLLVAKYTRAALVRLTDGNVAAVENVRRVVDANGFEGSTRVSCAVLQWGSCGDRTYDLVLAADCLFFDDGRSALVTTMWAALAEGGRALVTAPRRGATLEKFRAEAEAAGFACTMLERYNPQVWERHLELKAGNGDYDEDIHYPILLHLIKPTRNGM